MTDTPIKVLLIEDNPGDTVLIRESLAEVKGVKFYLECASELSIGLERLNAGDIDVVVLDLSLPDSSGLDTVVTMRVMAPETPFVVLTGLNDEELALQAVKAGAQDYLIKGHVDSNSLGRSLRYAIERHRVRKELSSQSMMDELTGLYNRRGFIAYGEQHLKLCKRTERGLMLAFIDLDGMKIINDTYGHREGDLALIDTAKLIKEVFRESDIIARIGGDEFAVIILGGDPERAQKAIQKRLTEKEAQYNAITERPFKLSASIGIAEYKPNSMITIQELLAQADYLMYEQKRSKR